MSTDGLNRFAVPKTVIISWLAGFHSSEVTVPLPGLDDLSLPAPICTGEMVRLKPLQIGWIRAATVVLGRWFTRAKWIWVIAIAAPVLSLLHPRGANPGLIAAVLIPLFIANRGGLTPEASGGALALSSPALWSPTPALFTGLVLAAVTILASLPAVLVLPLDSSVHLLLGIIASSLWLTWTCLQLERPSFGIAIYALLWYLESFCGIPPAFDIIGLHRNNAIGFGIAAAASVALAALCVHSDRAHSGRTPKLSRKKLHPSPRSTHVL